VRHPHRSSAAVCGVYALAVVLAGCAKPSPPAGTDSNVPAKLTMTALTKATEGQFQPVPLPDPQVPGYRFPEAEDTVVGWTRDNNAKAIDAHLWGLWTALTSESDQLFNGQKLRVFETWYDPDDLRPSPGPNVAAGAKRIRQPRRLEVPRQFEHGGTAPEPMKEGGAHGQSTVLAGVKYDPTASQFILDKGLLSRSQLTAYLNTDRLPAVPALPNTAVSLKPAYLPVPSQALQQGRYFLLREWPGPPDLTFDAGRNLWVGKAFGENAWGQCVWIDIQGAGNTGGGVDKTCTSNGSSGPPPAPTASTSSSTSA
jgi:hypothetical protein